MKKLKELERSDYLLTEEDLKRSIKAVTTLPVPDASWLGQAVVVTGYDPLAMIAKTYKCVLEENAYAWKLVNYFEDQAPAPCTNLWANSKRDKDAGRATVYIHWDDPQDTDDAHWLYTVVVKKKGAKPQTPYDGELVGYSSVRDQYAGKQGFVDSIDVDSVDSSDIIDNTDYKTEDRDVYWYEVFAVSKYGKWSASGNPCTAMLTWKKYQELVRAGIGDHALEVGDIVQVSHTTESVPTFGEPIQLQLVDYDHVDTGTEHNATFMAVNALFRGSFDHRELEYALSQDNSWGESTLAYFKKNASGQFVVFNVGDTDEPGDKKYNSPKEQNEHRDEPTVDAVYQKNPCTDAAIYGRNKWSDSTLRCWLNSDEIDWFKPSSIFEDDESLISEMKLIGTGTKDAPTGFGDYGYPSSIVPEGWRENPLFNGFLLGLDEEFKEVLATVRVKTTKPTWECSPTELPNPPVYETEDKVWLPAYIQLFGVDGRYPKGVSKDEGHIFDIYANEITNTRLKLIIPALNTTYDSQGQVKDLELDQLTSWYMRSPVRLFEEKELAKDGNQHDLIEFVTNRDRRFDVDQHLGEDGGAGRSSFMIGGQSEGNARDHRDNVFTPVGSKIVFFNNTSPGIVPCMTVA